MLYALAIVVSLLAGLLKAPWWFWIVGGATLALLDITSPERLRPSYTDMSTLEAMPLLWSDLKAVSAGCVAAAVAFSAGSIMSWTLPI
jgi:hypothetical protein